MGASQSQEPAGVLALNWYYARTPGQADEVLATRLRACDVRVGLGIPAGRVLRRLSGPDDLPDVIWDCRFADVRAHDADMAVRAASVDFEAVRAHMRGITRRFERVLYSVFSDDPALAHPPRPGSTVEQVWLQARLPDPAGGTAAPWAGTPPAGARRRIGPAARLPDWIVERSRDGGAPLPAALAAAFDEPIFSTWETIR